MLNRTSIILFIFIFRLVMGNLMAIKTSPQEIHLTSEQLSQVVNIENDSSVDMRIYQIDIPSPPEGLGIFEIAELQTNQKSLPITIGANQSIQLTVRYLKNNENQEDTRKQRSSFLTLKGYQINGTSQSPFVKNMPVAFYQDDIAQSIVCDQSTKQLFAYGNVPPLPLSPFLCMNPLPWTVVLKEVDLKCPTAFFLPLENKTVSLMAGQLTPISFAWNEALRNVQPGKYPCEFSFKEPGGTIKKSPITIHKLKEPIKLLCGPENQPALFIEQNLGIHFGYHIPQKTILTGQSCKLVPLEGFDLKNWKASIQGEDFTFCEFGDSGTDDAAAWKKATNSFRKKEGIFAVGICFKPSNLSKLSQGLLKLTVEDATLLFPLKGSSKIISKPGSDILLTNCLGQQKMPITLPQNGLFLRSSIEGSDAKYFELIENGSFVELTQEGLRRLESNQSTQHATIKIWTKSSDSASLFGTLSTYAIKTKFVRTNECTN